MRQLPLRGRLVNMTAGPGVARPPSLPPQPLPAIATATPRMNAVAQGKEPCSTLALLRRHLLPAASPAASGRSAASSPHAVPVVRVAVHGVLGRRRRPHRRAWG